MNLDALKKIVAAAVTAALLTNSAAALDPRSGPAYDQARNAENAGDLSFDNNRARFDKVPDPPGSGYAQAGRLGLRRGGPAPATLKEPGNPLGAVKGSSVKRGPSAFKKTLFVGGGTVLGGLAGFMLGGLLGGIIGALVGGFLGRLGLRLFR